MKSKGIHYDIGIATIDGSSTRPTLPPSVMERELADIADGLHANAVRITGDDIDRIVRAAGLAADQGLDVWLSPMLPNANADTTLAAVAESARAAASLRRDGANAVVVIGCELSVFMSGILPGATHGDRLALLSDPARLMAEVSGAGLDPQATFADFLDAAVKIAREKFRGPLTYASGLWEEVGWSAFDMVGIDAYRDATNESTLADRLRSHAMNEEPTYITEFGCATYEGASGAGGMGWDVIDREEGELRDGIIRDEEGQAAEIISLLDLYTDAGVNGAFVYTYAAPSYPSSTDPARDLDTASFALVRTWPDGHTEPKAAYRAVAERYCRPNAE